MQYLYHPDAKEEQLKIDGDDFRYLVKVRRFKEGKEIDLRNLKDHILYRYKITNINKKDLTLSLIDSKEDVEQKEKKLHIIWCVIDPKTIYSTIPMLNQIGVSKISFVYCRRSQRNFKIDLQKIKKILINSSQQCGRTSLMECELLDSLLDAIRLYKDFAVMDFGGESEYKDIKTALIGCEGGFSDDEKNLLLKHPKIGLKTSNILKSETAVLSFSIKALI
ncbi:MAG: 16S rRNA (uracil(1498)-N(3))-methyltransferase [Sulfurospirillum sp.]|nr:MAG: 16S rRNA (uracil(1498)-N(3))-methyltransferase [Sulfurospirillum sp.]